MAITLVQQKSGTGTSLSFTSATTAGNCVVAGFTDESGATGVTSVTLGGAAGNFAQLAAAAGNPASKGEVLAALWADPNCAGGQTAVAVTATGTTNSPTIWIAEFSGIVSASPLDKDSFATGTAGSWSSGTTGTTTQAVELWLGALCNASSSSAAGPASPWTNFSVNDTSGDTMLYGYQIRSTTGTAAYSGTGGSSAGWAAVVVAVKGAASAAVPGTVQPLPTVPVPRRRRARGQWQSVTGQAFVKVPAPAEQPRPAPRRKLARAFIRFTPVTTTNAPPVIPPAGTVQPAATVPLPRRKPVRAVSRGIAVPGAYGTAPAQEFQVQPRRKLARAVWQRITGQAFVKVAAPRQEFRVPPRRTRGRAVVRFTPVSTVNAPPTRNLIVCIASAAGTDDYANTYPEGVQVGPASNAAQLQLIPTIPDGNAAQIKFAMPARNLDNTPNIAGGVIGGSQATDLVISGPALSPAQGNDWVQLVLFSGDGLGDEASMSFRYITTGGGVIPMSNANGSGWTFGVPVTMPDLTLNGQTISVPQSATPPPGLTPGSYNVTWGQGIHDSIASIITALEAAGIFL